jgi:holo-[acyl-carrier protein] synthase
MKRQIFPKASQILGLGTDIIEVQRIKEAIERHGEKFIEKIFTSKEQDYCRRYSNAELHFAGRFAAKEAVLKACGTGLKPELTWHAIEIINDEQGKPEVYLSSHAQKLLKISSVFLSISHCNAYAMATAIAVS